jgi:cytochrome b561
MVLGIRILVIAILMIIIFPDESDESDESSGKFSRTQLSPTAAATAHFSLLLFAQPLAGWLVSWLVVEEIRFSCKTLEPNSS